MSAMDSVSDQDESTVIRLRFFMNRDRVAFRVLQRLDSKAQRQWVLDACDKVAVLQLAPEYAAELGIASPVTDVPPSRPETKVSRARTRKAVPASEPVPKRDVTDLGFNKDAFLASLTTAFDIDGGTK